MIKNKKIVTFTVLAVVINLIFSVRHSQAAEPFYNFTSSATTASANSSSTITFTLEVRLYKCSVQYVPATGSPYWVYPPPSSNCSSCTYADCNDLNNPAPQNLSPRVEIPAEGSTYGVTTTGSGNILSSASIATGADGKATFTLKSSVAETKTVNIAGYGKNSDVIASKTVTFTAPATTTTPKKITTPTTTAPVEQKPPVIPELITTKVGDAVVDITKPIIVGAAKSLVLSGKTVANGVVKLYIFSEPKTATITADKDGNWGYSVSGLPAGDHHIEVEVTDPLTSKTSERKNLLAFTVSAVAPVIPGVSVAQEAANNWYWWVLRGILVLGITGVAGYWFWWRKRNITTKKLPQNSVASPMTPDDSDASIERLDTHDDDR